MSYPICKDCYFYSEHPVAGSTPARICTRVPIPDLVTGVIHFADAFVERYGERNDNCGLKGRHFQPKNGKERFDA